MLAWLKSLVGMDDVQNEIGLSEKEIKFLKKDFAQLDKDVDGISGRLLRFLLDDQGDEVLQELLGIQNAGSTLQLICAGGFLSANIFVMVEGDSPRVKFFEKTSCQDTAFWYRLAQIYDTASRTESRHLQCYGFRQGLEWLEVFLGEALQVQLNFWYSDGKEKPGNVQAALIEEMAVLAGNSADALVRGALLLDPADPWYNPNKEWFLSIPGIAESFTRYPATVIEALNQSEYQAKVFVLDMLSESKAELDPFVESVARLAASSSKTVRTAAEKLLLAHPQISQSALKDIIIKGKTGERYHAIKLLWKIAGDECREFLEQRVEEEKSKKNTQEIEQILSFKVSTSQTADTESQTPTGNFALPPLEPIELSVPLPPETKQALHEAAQKHNEEAKKEWARMSAEIRQGKTFHDAISSKNVEKAFTLLQELVLTPKSKTLVLRLGYNGGKAFQPFIDFALRPELQLIHVVRLLVLAGLIEGGKGGRRGSIEHWAEQIILRYRKEREPNLDLRRLAAIFDVIGLDEHGLSSYILAHFRWEGDFDWEENAIWPFFAERLHLLEEAFGLRNRESGFSEYWETEIRQNAFSILKVFPHIPEQFVPMLWEIAMGTGKSERGDAQICLRNYPEKEQRIIAALSDGKKGVRAAAAQWLGELHCTEAIPALSKALEKEKYEEIKGIMMQALEKLGVPMEQFIDRLKLLKEAQKGLVKGVPVKLQWFPSDRLPAVHWEKTGDSVKSEILQWFLLQSFKMKNPEPNPLLRLYCSFFRQDEREALGKYVLESWIAEDTKPQYTYDEAKELAEKDLQQTRGYIRQFPQYYPNWNEEQYFQTTLNHYLTACLASAISSKGVLAVAGACAGGEIVPIVNRYLKDWYGKRAAQCKVLVQMLSWIEHDLAIQLLLSVGNRFRTKSIQEEAARQVELLAERKGWTRDELADRTIPTAGFNEHGLLELDYGLCKFSATLGESFSIILTDENGKQIKSLPAARKAEDQELVKSTKKQFSAAKKEIKTVLSMQKERLYEAMCTQRTWHMEDWQLYLNQHPIVGRYCQMLVWLAYEDETLFTSFRPLADRTLTDHQDEEITIDSHYTIRLAHDCNLPEDDRKAWVEHFSDYEVVSLFPQFGRASLTLNEEIKKSTEIADFQGHLISAFTLRGKATKLGYTRGEAEDGGWFYIYKKDFPGLGLEAIIEFTGNFMPEKERTVALQTLYFYRQSKKQASSYSRYGSKIQLGQIPAVLLIECWNDIRAIAAEGTGYDPAWEEKTEY